MSKDFKYLGFLNVKKLSKMQKYICLFPKAISIWQGLLKPDWASFLEPLAGRLFGLLACQYEINTNCWHQSAGKVDNRYNVDQ